MTKKAPDDGWHRNEAYIRKLCAYKLSSHPDEVEDAVQEVALAYCEALEKGTEILSPEKWLTRVAVNTVNDIYRRLASEGNRLVPLEEGLPLLQPAPEETAPLPEAALLGCRAAFLETLGEDELLLFRLRFQKREKLKTIASRMGLTETNVKQRVFRLKRKAKRFVEDWSGKNL